MTTLVLDAGDLFGNRTKKDLKTAEFLAGHTAKFGYDAIGLGERDLNFGLEFLRRMIQEHKLPYTNANVRDAATGELILPEFLVIERAGVRFGVCSVMDPAHKIISMAAKDGEYEVAEPIATLRDLLPRLREQCDTVVLLSHLGDQPTEAIVQEVQGIDLVVVGHSFKPYNREKIVADAILLSAVYDGRVIGRADVRVSPESGKVMAVDVAVTSLDDAVADDPAMLESVNQFLEGLEAERLAQRAAFPRDLGSPDESFLGNANCSSCHKQIYEEWRKTDHARAFTSLRAKEMQFEPECLACHTTGYRHHNGYDEQQQSQLSHIQCEACHGYGTQHDRSGAMLKTARESCVQCHDNDNRPCFDGNQEAVFEYAKAWEKIAH
ncbi:MAG TPA: multiheme c-type cytochrome [Candidatus Krumholzibacteria bacterium]|nr:multiheme c-type cytochrome [Candidatus Krumholzibacteria bacterium]HPD72173.1 multiheme c-type cytochrome [Candidatus Krumholzibacteria bacterium]HRY40895.1 multiheme c-type cytochrome [Candidatus Krumholzibacteria bacterium]